MEKDEFYKTPESDLTKKEAFSLKKDRLTKFCVSILVVNFGVQIVSGMMLNVQGPQLLGKAFSALGLPLVIVTISQVVPVFRNDFIRMQIFKWVSILLLVAGLASMFAVKN